MPFKLFIPSFKNIATVFYAFIRRRQLMKHEPASSIGFWLVELDGGPFEAFVYSAEHSVLDKKGELGFCQQWNIIDEY